MPADLVASATQKPFHDKLKITMKSIRQLYDSFVTTVRKCNVKATMNTKNAMKVCFSDNPPGFISLDTMMPEVDGLALYKELK